MANTALIKTLVEPYVREHLEREYGQPFAQQFLDLPGGGRHEFDAVSRDRTIVTSIKSHSGLTSGGKRPGGKILACYAELYYLLQVDAPIRILVLTNPEFHDIFVSDSRGRLAPGLEIELVALPEDIQRQIQQVTHAASREMARSAQAVQDLADLEVSGDLEPDHDL
jgi:hypothetical protein